MHEKRRYLKAAEHVHEIRHKFSILGVIKGFDMDGAYEK